MERVKSGGASFFQRVTAFSAGFVIAASMGFIHLNHEIAGLNAPVLNILGKIEKDMASEATRLRQRVDVLEKEVAQLKKMK